MARAPDEGPAPKLKLKQPPQISPALRKLLGGPRAPAETGRPSNLQVPLKRTATGGAPGSYTVGRRNTNDVVAPERTFKPLKSDVRQLKKKKPIVADVKKRLGRRVPGESRNRPTGDLPPMSWGQR